MKFSVEKTKTAKWYDGHDQIKESYVILYDDGKRLPVDFDNHHSAFLLALALNSIFEAKSE